MNTQNTLILYTDGSFLPNNIDYRDGYHGSGAHGYVYDPNSTTKPSGDKPSKHTITNIGYIENELVKVTDNVVIVSPLYYIDACYSYINKGTNNIAEIDAIVNVLTDVIKNIDLLSINNILLYSDSQYTLDSIENLKTNSNYLNNPELSNVENLKEVKNILVKLEELNIQISFRKVKGHSTNLGNMLADRLAYFGRIQSCRRELISVFNITDTKIKKYWKVDNDRHPFINFKQLFFTNTLRAKPDEIIYSILDYGTNDMLGKKTQDATFGLVILKEPPKLIEDAIKSYHKFALAVRTLNVISTLNLALLYDRSTFKYYELFDLDSFIYYNKNHELRNIEDKPIVYTVQPSGLAEQALSKMASLNYLIHYHKDKSAADKDIMIEVDITNEIYNITTDKKGNVKYNLNIENGTNFIRVPVNNAIGIHSKSGLKFDLIIPLDLGKDTLSRNQFKALEKNQPKVFLIIRRISDEMISYYTIIETKEGDIACYCNYYSNKMLIPPEQPH